MIKRMLASTVFLISFASEEQTLANAEGPDPSTVGPQVGAQVPDFALPDQSGQERTLQSLMGPNGLVLVFYRSADW